AHANEFRAACGGSGTRRRRGRPARLPAAARAERTGGQCGHAGDPQRGHGRAAGGTVQRGSTCSGDGRSSQCDRRGWRHPCDRGGQRRGVARRRAPEWSGQPPGTGGSIRRHLRGAGNRAVGHYSRMERPDLILVLNSGSSSLKYQLLDLSDPAARRGGLVERIGEPGAVPDHRAAVARVLDELPDPDAVTVVGHRVVHVGSLTAPTLIDDDVIAIIEGSAPLAPLHHPPNLAGILAARDALPGVPQVAVFDTAFHVDLPAAVATYAIDRAVTQRLR